MDDPVIRLTYDGGDAANHTMDMRHLGLSLQGADRIISDGLILLLFQRAPKRGERAPLIVKAREPVAGSYDITSYLQSAAWALPLAYPVAQDLAGEFIKEWWTAIKARFSGKSSTENKAIDAMLQMNRDHLAARARSEAHQHKLQLAFLQTLALQQRPLEQFAAPIGHSVSSALIRSGSAQPVSIDAEEADHIREMGELTWEPLREETLRTDGFKFHTNGLSIENPTKDGYLMARVLDPKFEEQENAYTEAAQRRSQIVVLARRGYKNGALIRMDIVDFIRELAP